MTSVLPLWTIHQQAQWPRGIGEHEGELMTLDTVIGGCVTYYLEELELDGQRFAILSDCLTDLASLLPDLCDEAEEYFRRLQTLGQIVMETRRGNTGGDQPVA